MKNNNHKANSNKGTNGVNKTYSKVHGNRGTQMNSNNKKNNSSK